MNQAHETKFHDQPNVCMQCIEVMHALTCMYINIPCKQSIPSMQAITITKLQCCMKVMSHNFSNRNVDACIRAVLEDVPQLPKKSTIADMMVESRSLAHLHLAEELIKQSSNTLHSVGTTRIGDKFGGFQVSVQESFHTHVLQK